MRKKLVIVQPYVPTYRVAFFETLSARLRDKGIDCVVTAGMPKGEQAMRGDAVRPDWLHPLEQKSLHIKGRSVALGYGQKPWRNADAVILGLEGSSFPVYQALLEAQVTGLRVGLWGHVRPYVNSGNPVDLWLEKLQLKASDHVFAYTPGGRDYALTAGVAPNKVTTVMNSLDTSSLETSKQRLTPELIGENARKWGIDPTRTLCFVGGLDESKRIGFLVEVLDRLWQRDQSVRILVGGEGPQKDLLRPAFERGQAISLGYLNLDEKALVLATSRALAMPGRIGLVAVDALVMHRPVLTTNWPYHAPEFEYLTEGTSKITSADDPQSYADLVLRFLDDECALYDHTDWNFPGLHQMVKNFAGGVEILLTSKSVARRSAAGLFADKAAH